LFTSFLQDETEKIAVKHTNKTIVEKRVFIKIIFIDYAGKFISDFSLIIIKNLNMAG